MATLLRMITICAAAGALAAAHVALRGLSWTVDRAKVQERIDRVEQVKGSEAELRARHGFSDIEELKNLVATGNVVVIDARPRELFEKSHLLVEGEVPTLNVEPEHAARHIDRLMQVQALPIVIYCNSAKCTLSEELIVELQPYGFQLRFFIPGWEGIEAAGLPSASGPDHWDPLGTGVPQGAPVEPTADQTGGEATSQEAAP